MRLWSLKSIKTKIILWIVLLTIICMGILTFYIFINVREALTAQIETSSMEIVNGRADEMNKWLMTGVKEIELLSNTNTIQLMQLKYSSNYLFTNKEIIGDIFESLFVTQEDGMGITADYVDIDYADKRFFKAIMNGEKYVISNPFISELTGNPVFAIAHRVPDPSGEAIGIVGGLVNLETLSEIAGKIKIGEIGYGFVADGDGLIIAHMDDSYVMDLNVLESDQAGFKGLSEAGKDMRAGKSGIQLIEDSDGVTSSLIYCPVPGTPNWSLGVVAPIDELYADVNHMIIIVLVIIGIITAIFALTAYLLGNSITKPIKALEVGVEQFGDGDLNVIFSRKTNDEIGQISDSLKAMVVKFNSLMHDIQNASYDIKESSESLSSSSQSMAVRTKKLQDESRAIEEFVENTSSSIEEVTSGIQEVASSANIISETAKKLSREISNTEKSVKNGLDELTAQSEKINHVERQNAHAREIVETVATKSNNVQDIVKTISSISEQTNLLALNAAIEAARAGEAGKGFAVVADEIRKLAEESQQATSNIASILNEIDEGSKNAKDAVEQSTALYQDVVDGKDKIANEFDMIYQSVEKITTGIKDLTESSLTQSSSTEEMAKAMENSSNSMIQVSEKMDHITEQIHESSNTAIQLNELSKELENLSETLSELIAKFKL